MIIQLVLLEVLELLLEISKPNAHSFGTAKHKNIIPGAVLEQKMQNVSIKKNKKKTDSFGHMVTIFATLVKSSEGYPNFVALLHAKTTTRFSRKVFISNHYRNTRNTKMV